MQFPIPTGTLLHNRYKITGVLGQGECGWAYIAEDQKRLNERCVLEEFIPTKATNLDYLREQFQQKVSILAQLQHPQIPRFRVMIVHDRRLFWVREYVEGISYRAWLSDRLVQSNLFSEAEVLHLFETLLPVLSYVHDRGIIHQNISPNSIILRHSDQLPVLIQFGLLKEVAFNLKLKPHKRSDDWGYAPLEQRLGDRVDRDSDLYALAVVAIMLLTGCEPEELYDDKTQRWSWQEWTIVSPHFAQILERMLWPNPDKRFSTAEKVIKAISSYPQGVADKKPCKIQNSPQTSDLKKALPSEPPIWRDFSLLLLATVFVGLAGIAIWRMVAIVREPISLVTPNPIAHSPNVQLDPKDEQAVQEALRDRRKKLVIPYDLFTDLVDEQFYAKYPQFQNRSLKSDARSSDLQREWNAIANSVLDKLESLSSQARTGMGQYNRASYNSWLASVNVSSRSLEALSDAQFLSWFPEQQGKSLNPRKFGQVWYAIAHDQANTIQTKSVTVKTLLFKDQQTLKNGQGRVYVTRLLQNQSLQLNLKAPKDSTRISIFPPADSAPALKNSSEISWSTKVERSGNYEIVIVPHRSNSVTYQLSLSTSIAPSSPPNHL
ncbi:serine/threonine protein kinase [Phormidesmis priestleyi]